MKYLRLIWKYKFILPPAIALLALLYLVAYFMLTGWWTHQIFISKVNITWSIPIKKAQASEMTVEQYIKYVFGKQGSTAIKIAKAESGMRCDAVTNEPNKTVSIGLFQINSVHYKKYKLTDVSSCRGNIDIAKQIYDDWGGWEAWSTYKNGSYKNQKTE